jgi:hypothetical protein
MEADVAKGRLTGIGTDGKNRWKVEGTLSAEGVFSGLIGSQVLTGKFKPEAFEGSYLSTIPTCGRRPLTLQRTTP